jgi:hypothetical protein
MITRLTSSRPIRACGTCPFSSRRLAYWNVFRVALLTASVPLARRILSSKLSKPRFLTSASTKPPSTGRLAAARIRSRRELVGGSPGAAGTAAATGRRRRAHARRSARSTPLKPPRGKAATTHSARASTRFLLTIR